MKSTYATNYIPVDGVIRVNYPILPEIEKAAGRVQISEQNTKLGPIPSFNTAPSNYNYKFNDLEILGTCEQSCRKCYGMKGNYTISTALNSEIINTVLIRENMADVFEQIKNYCKYIQPRIFRIHSNGDFLNFEEFTAWVKVAKACPKTIFYGYTKNYAWLDFAFDGAKIPKNFIVNISVFDGYGEKIARELHEKYKKNTNIFIAEKEHRENFDGMAEKVQRCPAYAYTIKKNGKRGAVKLQHDKKDPIKFTCLWCGKCQKAGQIISTLIH